VPTGHLIANSIRDGTVREVNRSTVRLLSAFVAAALCASVGATAAARTPAPPTPTPAPATGAVLSEGTYRGVLSWPQGSYRYSSSATTLSSTWSLFDGILELTVSGRSVTGGWSFAMHTVGGGESGSKTGTGSGDATATGSFEGTSSAPCMEGGLAIDAVITITDAAGTMELPIDDTFPLSCEKLTWTISAASCTTASGEWTVPLADGITMSGASFPTNGTFQIWRVGDGPGLPEENAAVDAQLVEMERIINSEPFDGPALAAVLRSIAEFEGNLARNIECGQRSPENMRIAGNFLFRLLVDRFLQDQPVDLQTLRWMAYAALNTGQIGSAAAQPERAAHLAQIFMDRLSEMVVAAEAEGNYVRLAAIEIFARQYGWHDVEAAAGAAFERVNPEG